MDRKCSVWYIFHLKDSSSKECKDKSMQVKKRILLEKAREQQNVYSTKDRRCKREEPIAKLLTKLFEGLGNIKGSSRPVLLGCILLSCYNTPIEQCSNKTVHTIQAWAHQGAPVTL